MKNRRLLTVSFIVMASVFLFTGCGEPTFWQPQSSSITRISQTDSSLGFSVKVQQYADGASLSDGPGLFLAYVVSDYSSASAFSSSISSEFKSTAGSSISEMHSLDVSDSKAVLKVTKNDTDYNLCCFRTTASVQQAPFYLYNMNSDPVDFEFELSLESDGKISFKANGTDCPKLLRFNGEAFPVDVSSAGEEDFASADSNDYFVHVFAAFYAQEGDFSNVYWSELKYIGCMALPEIPE